MSLVQLSQKPGHVDTIELASQYQPDPLGIYQTLCAYKAHNLLLESAEINSKDNLKSLILVDAALKITCNGNQVTCQSLSNNGASLLAVYHTHHQQYITQQTADELTLVYPSTNPNLDEDTRLKSPSVFDALRLLIDQVKPLTDNEFAMFLGGAFAYDMLATFEQLPNVPDSDNTCPDFVFYVAETLLSIDHQAQQTHIIGNVFSGENAEQEHAKISRRVEMLDQQLRAEIEPNAHVVAKPINCELSVDLTDAEYEANVEFLQRHIFAGDIFQVVPSRTFSLPCTQPYQAYAQLKKQNPSPYMFYIQDEDFIMFGASPESALKYTQSTNQVEVYPIAGTRPRGKYSNGQINPDLDSRIELDLREDTKEKAEHLMLVDLARNDIARVSVPGSRYVADLLKVDRYSQVMHLVSRVVGQLRQDLDALHAYQACMNMGTLVGAPKVKAAELIRKIEKKRRGSYGGAVGYMNGKGDMDTCIVIRSAFVRNDTAYIQAGAGVVFDSDPKAESAETRSKAQAVIRAIQSAHNQQAN